MLKKKPNFKRLEKKLIDKQIGKLALLANDLKAGIINRTQSGTDVNGKSFKRYTPEYAKKKGSTKPNLTVQAHMLNNITWKKIRYGIRMYFKSSEEMKKARGNQRKRKFFGLDKKQVKMIQKRLQKI